ncbi:MAG: hypothetical protein U1E43_08825 [Rhodospirillales bacterium]
MSERGLIVETEAASAEALTHTTAEASANAAPPALLTMPAEVASRDDVVRLLDRICAYYERYEPSSPVPLLLARARRWVFKDFIDVLRDIAPDAVAQAEAIRGHDAT